MIKEARGYGATISEAKENAIALLGAGLEDDVQFEVVSTPKKKVLGLFGGNSAEVRAYIELPDEKPARKQNKLQKNKNIKKSEKVQKAEKKESKPEVKAEIKEKINEEIKEEIVNAVDESEIDKDSKTGRAISYLHKILPSLGCDEVSIKAVEKENGAIILLEGENVGVIIGHRGETLDSLQYLTSLAANNVGGYFKVALNIGNYREKREQTLKALANRIAKQVLSNGKSRSLEPMNPYERRIIHTAVQEIEGVVSSSYGEGNNRRVVIYPEGGEMRPPRNDRGGRRDNRKGNRPSRSVNQTVSATVTREPKKDTDIPLYGKIN